MAQKPESVPRMSREAKSARFCDCLLVWKDKSATALAIHSEPQDRSQPCWTQVLELIRAAADEASEQFDCRSMPVEDWVELTALPREIETLTQVKKIVLYGSHLRSIPPEIGRLQSLESFTVYTSYSLHWLPYELTRCAKLVESSMSTRAMYGNRKNFLPFPVLGAPIDALTPSTCSVCDGPFEGTPELYWHTLWVGTDFVPLLLHSCSTKCTDSVPDAPGGFHTRPHKGGRLTMDIDTLEAFERYFLMPRMLLSRVPDGVNVAPEVWAAVAEAPDILEKIVRMKGMPEVALVGAASHEDEDVRRKVAGKQRLPAKVCEMLSRDASDRIRQRLARNPSAPPSVLERLASDPVEKIRRFAAERLAKDE